MMRARSTLIPLLTLLALAVAGCATEDGPVLVEPTATPEATTEATTPGPTATATPTPGGTALPDPPSPGGTAPPRTETFTGTLGGSDIEGGCMWLDAEDGTRYELIAGPAAEVAIDPGSLQIVTTAGEVVAGVGDTVAVQGAVDEGLMTFCQVGTNLVVFDASAG